MKRDVQKIIISVICCLLFVSCEDFLTTPPLDEIADDLWWKEKSQVEMMVDDCYTLTYDIYQVAFRDCLSDNAKHRDKREYISIGNGTYDTYNAYVESQYNYATVAKLNYVLEGLEKAKEFLTDAEYRQFKAQVQFIRAFNYYDMLFYFGDIPLITKNLTVSESRETTRQPRSEVLDFILKELEENVLSNIETIPTTETGCINKDVVNAYLARICLFEKKYDKAIKYANAVIDTHKYSLFGNYEELFRPQNDGKTNEIIFERQYNYPLYVHSLNRSLAQTSSVYNGWGHVNISQNMVDEYECIAGHDFHDCETLGCEYVAKRAALESETKRGEYQYRDPRLTATVVYPFWEWKVDGITQVLYGVDDPLSKDYLKNASYQSGFLLSKWLDMKGDNSMRTKAEKNMTILRYADVLLMKAEALIESNQNLQEAANLLNMIRKRTGMPENITVASQDDMRKKLRHERRVELAFEGLRYYDIIRWRIAGEVKPGVMYGARLKAVSEDMDHKIIEERFWDDKMYLFPIPQKAIDNNPNLTQNPDW